MEGEKLSFDIDLVMDRVREAVRPFPKGAQHQLADEGFSSVFEQVLGCILSTRTLDEISIDCARKLFKLGRTPAQIVELSLSRIDDAISSCRFHETKARDILEIARMASEEYGGTVPCTSQVLLSFPGVGPKCANLVLGVACGQACIAVDVHVHRITNRWGYVSARTPEKTLAALEKVLPKRYWIEINGLLVPFGKHICLPRSPRCSTCPVLEMCRQMGVPLHG